MGEQKYYDAKTGLTTPTPNWPGQPPMTEDKKVLDLSGVMRFCLKNPVKCIIGFFICIGLMAICQNTTTTSASGIQYRIVDEWQIPNGGYGRVIVIDPANRNLDDMRALGETLRRVTARDRNAIVIVFDDVRAAAMRQDAMSDNLSATDGAFYDKHDIGVYTRNINSGYHKLQITLDGLNGTVTDVGY